LTFPEITQENFRSLLPGKIAALAVIEQRASGVSPKDALLRVYRSALYRELEREATKRWWESPEQLYADFQGVSE
jgi:hypothetical protein